MIHNVPLPNLHAQAILISISEYIEYDIVIITLSQTC